ncbi:MAG: radical SAM protein [bacterium]
MRVPEGLIIRPPSEAGSLLVRVVRGCHWNRCRFCGIYDLYGQPFEVRPLEDVLEDIDLLKEYWGDLPKTAFLGDADPLERPVAFLAPILDRLRERFPGLVRVTAYARASSLYRKSPEELETLARHGLDRVHVGLETGCDALLRFHKKGISQKVVIEAGRRVREAGIELSFYVLLGLGGREHWEAHAADSALVINETVPEFIRIRRLWIHPLSRLASELKAGTFQEQTAEGTVRELRRLVEGITVQGPFLACDHANNYFPVEGRFLEDREVMLGRIDAFLAQPPEERERHYRCVGSVI